MLHNRPSPATAVTFATNSLFASKCSKLNYRAGIISKLSANFCVLLRKVKQKRNIQGGRPRHSGADSAHACTYCKVFPYRFMNSWTDEHFSTEHSRTLFLYHKFSKRTKNDSVRSVQQPKC